MAKHLIVAFFITTILFSCKSKTNSNPESTVNSNADTTKPFPIAELLQAQFDDVLHTPYFMYMITKKENKKQQDSVVIHNEEFSKLIEPLTKIDLATKQFKTKFKETAFNDLSTQSITIITTSLDKNSSFKNVTTLLNNESNTNNLKSMYFVFNETCGDSSFRTNYYLKANKSLTINKIVQFKKETPKGTTEFVNWNDKPE